MYAKKILDLNEVAEYVKSKALEQISTIDNKGNMEKSTIPMSVIEDIRKEIEEEIDKCHSNGKYSYDNSRIGLRKALEIIDKHIYKGTKQ